MKKVLIRSDASPSAGAGHLMRSIALGQYCRSQGIQVRFLTTAWTAWLSDYLKSQDFEIRWLYLKEGEGGSEKDTKILLKELRDGFDWVVLDNYFFDETYQSALKRSGIPFVYVDERARRYEYPDLQIAPSFDITSPGDEQSEKILAGPDYLMIRREFLDFKKRPKEGIANLLITLGASSQQKVLLKIIDAIDKIKFPDLQVKVVAGFSDQYPPFPLPQEIGKHSVDWRQLSFEMAPLYDWADLAIAAAGGTCAELCYFGITGIVGALSENQQNWLEGLKQRDVFETVGRYDHVTAERLGASLQKILDHPERIQSRNEQAKKLVDGKACERILEAMQRIETQRQTMRVG